MTYRHTVPLHGDYLDEEVAPLIRREIEQHLAICPACRADLEQLRALKNLMSGVTVPDAGENYFRSTERSILERTVEGLPDEAPGAVPPIDSVRHMLKTLIRIAAVVTLLFGTFYLSDNKNAAGPSRWAGTPPPGRLAQGDSASATSPQEIKVEGIKEISLPDSAKSKDIDTNGGQ
jgi:anti-sigma factor RsiW